MKRKLVIKEIAWVLFVIIAGLYLAGLLSSCNIMHQGIKTHSVKVIYQKESNEGRKMYTVIFPDGTSMDMMYWEEVKRGLNTGRWGYNESLK